jgi:DNA-binding winged helix-turn-helix (wHTH) protein/Tol biopolymer transport system component
MGVVEEKVKHSLFHFDGFTLDLERRGLYRGQQRVHLTAKPLETLIFLVEQRGRTVEKQELLAAVWKDTFVTEGTLAQAVREIRRALGDDKEDPRFIQTVPRQGYRFVAEVLAGNPLAVPTVESQATAPVSLAAAERRRPRWRWIAAPAAALISLLAWFFWPHGQRGATNPVPSEPPVGRINKQLTAGEFSCIKPAFSRDGKLILYLSSSALTRGYSDLFIRQFPAGAPLRITDRANPSGDLPVFTADGKHIVFSIPRVDSAGTRHHDLWQVPALGGPPERFIEDASGAGFSPDEKWVAYTKHLPAGGALWLSPLGARQEHVELSAAGYTPRWSPDGTWLAYTTSDPNGGEGDIWVCQLIQSNAGQPAVSKQKQLTKERQQIYGLTWAADSRSLIFASRHTGSAQLYRVLLADGSMTALLTGVGDYEAPAAAPDGKTVIFHNKQLVNNLMLSTLGANCEAENITYNQFYQWPRLSPTGEKLISVLRQVDHTERPYLINLKTKESSQLSDRAVRHSGGWLDEENAVFLSPDAAAPKTELLAINTATRETRRLTLFSGEADWLAIHPDKQRVAVVLRASDGSEKILLRDLRNQVDETLHAGSEYEYLRWSPDGSALCWDRPGVSRNTPHQSGGIWVLELGRAEPRLIAHDGYCPVWSADGRTVYFTVREGRQGLWRRDLRQSSESLVCSWGKVFNYDLVGQRLVFAQHKNESQIYSLSLNQ